MLRNIFKDRSLTDRLCFRKPILKDRFAVNPRMFFPSAAEMLQNECSADPGNSYDDSSFEQIKQTESQIKDKYANSYGNDIFVDLDVTAY